MDHKRGQLHTSNAGIVQPDFCGGLVMSGDLVSAITETQMRFVNTTHRRNTPGRPSGAVPLWLFGK